MQSGIGEGSSIAGRERSRDSRRFFATHPVFTLREFATERQTTSARVKPLLTYHRRAGHIVSLRRGLYATVWEAAEGAAPDPLLVAAKLTEDATLAYASALTWHGLAHSARFVFPVLSKLPARPALINGVTYRFTLPPAALGERGLVTEVEKKQRDGVTTAVRVTTLERTLVDALDRPTLCGGWEEALHSLEGLAGIYLDGEAVVRYALALQNATLAAKVGYFLETNLAELVGVTTGHIAALRPYAPHTPHYATRERRDAARLVHGWNLLVPVLRGEINGGINGKDGLL